MKGLAKKLRFFSLVICAAVVVFAGCGNPWMKRITASLYDKPVTPGIPGEPALPVLTGTVLIAGTPMEGETLTADTSLLDGSGTIGYQWGQGNALAGPFTDIVSATASTYTLIAADNGKYLVVTVTRNGYSGNVSSLGLGPVAITVLNSAAKVGAFLAAAAGGTTPGSPVPLAVAMDLSGSGWADLLLAIQGADKYVNLDLSACTMSGTEFDPGAANTGEPLITALTLPGTTGSVKAGTSSDPTFRYFSALESVMGGAITTVGDYAFNSCNYLASVDLPAVTSIGNGAFAVCYSLTSMSLPASLISIGVAAFARSSLTSVSLPASLTSIGNGAFSGCFGLTDIQVNAANPNYSAQGGMLLNKAGTILIAYPRASEAVTVPPPVTTVSDGAFGGCIGLFSVSLPVATNISGVAFSGCFFLTSASLPAATSIGNEAFSYCNSITDITLGAIPPTTVGTNLFHGTGTNPITIHVPSGSVGAYTTWASTSAIISSFSPKTLTIAGDG